jgi:chorismate dehydratase
VNTWPFLHGLKKSSFSFSSEIIEEYPAQTAQSIKKGKVDVALVPVAVLPELGYVKIFSDFCIGADGKVDTVLLHSDVELPEIKKIYLDYQSRTSIALIKVLAQKYWKIAPEWISAEKGFENQIKDTTAGVVIGDRNFSGFSHTYTYDLAEEWKKHTSLPFVFAVWVAKKEIHQNVLEELNNAFRKGLNELENNIFLKQKPKPEQEELLFYLKERISYPFDLAKKEALQKFLSLTENAVLI